MDEEHGLLNAADERTLEQLAGFTGVGWTTSVLGYLSMIAGYGNSVLARLITEPQSLLYFAGVFFVATVGLDRISKRTEDDSD